MCGQSELSFNKHILSHPWESCILVATRRERQYSRRLKTETQFHTPLTLKEWRRSCANLPPHYQDTHVFISSLFTSQTHWVTRWPKKDLEQIHEFLKLLCLWFCFVLFLFLFLRQIFVPQAGLKLSW